jgi:hypothetical protein
MMIRMCAFKKHGIDGFAHTKCILSSCRKLRGLHGDFLNTNICYFGCCVRA